MKFYLECFWDLKDLWIKSNSYQIHLYPPTLDIYSPYRLIRNVKKISFIFCQSWLKKGRRLLEDDIWTDPNTAPGILFLLAEN